MRKNPEEGIIQAQVSVDGRQADLTIDGKPLSIPLEGTSEEGREAVKRRLILTARLRRTPIKATIAEPDRDRAIIIHPDGEIEDTGEQDDDRKSSPEMQAGPDGKRNADTGRAIRKAGAALLTVAILTGAGIGIHHMIERGQETARKQAYQTCTQARQDVESAYRIPYAKAYQAALSIEAGQVKNPKTVQNLHALASKDKGPAPLLACKSGDGKDALNGIADRMREAAASRTRLNGRMAAGAAAVFASRDAKVLDDARSALGGKKDEASKLLADSDGKVADNATRDGLQQAIGQAGRVKGDEAKDCRDAANALQAAIDRVNASIQAKSQADQQAAEQAAQAVQRPAQRQGTTQPQGTSRPASPPPSLPTAPQGGWSVPPAPSDDNSLPDHL